MSYNYPSSSPPVLPSQIRARLSGITVADVLSKLLLHHQNYLEFLMSISKYSGKREVVSV